MKAPLDLSAWRTLPGRICSVAPADMLFSGVALSGAPMTTPAGLSYLPAIDGCAQELLSGVPVLLDHRMESEAVVGVTECGWIDELGMLRVIVRLAATDLAKQIWLAIEAGALQGLSFTVSPLEALQRDGVIHVPKWRPLELSICPLGWDSGAQIDRFQDKAALLARMVHEVEESNCRTTKLVNKAASDRVAFMERVATAVACDLGVDPAEARASARRFAIETDPSLATHIDGTDANAERDEA